MCALLRAGETVRLLIHSGMYWFLGAVLLSIVNAILTKRLVQNTVRDSERDNSGQLNS